MQNVSIKANFEENVQAYIVYQTIHIFISKATPCTSGHKPFHPKADKISSIKKKYDQQDVLNI